VKRLAGRIDGRYAALGQKKTHGAVTGIELVRDPFTDTPVFSTVVRISVTWALCS
jgi:hypothetical protein